MNNTLDTMTHRCGKDSARAFDSGRIHILGGIKRERGCCMDSYILALHGLVNKLSVPDIADEMRHI